jgi:hypothetical protein
VNGTEPVGFGQAFAGLPRDADSIADRQNADSVTIKATAVKTWDGGGFAAANVSFR